MPATLEVPQIAKRSEQLVQSFLFQNVDWAFYETVLESVVNRSVRVTYDRGTLEIMSPLPEHESWSRLLHDIVKIIARTLKIKLRTVGSATWKSKILEKGLEPDECYYVQNAALIGNRNDIELGDDPPPDLAIEIDMTSSSLDRMGIYAALQVPEVWRFNGTRLSFNILRPNGMYAEASKSRAFPALPLKALERVLRLQGSMEEMELDAYIHKWVRKTLLKR